MELVRHRYFEASVKPITDLIVFGNGWYWRKERVPRRGGGWLGMGGAIASAFGQRALSFNVYVPLDALHNPPNIVVRLNGR